MRILALLFTVLLSAGCSGDGWLTNLEKADLEDVVQNGLHVTGTLSADATSNGDRLTIEVTARNDSDSAIDTYTGGCPWWPTVYAVEDESEELVWSLHGNGQYFCTTDLKPFVIQPGDSLVTTVGSYAVSDILGTRPSDLYRVKVQLRTAEPEVRSAEIPIGEIELTGEN